MIKILIKYNIKDIREQKNISQRKLAELSGLSNSTISLIESGKRDPTLVTLSYIASALSVRLEDLYTCTIIN